MDDLHYLLMKTQAHLNRWILAQAAQLGLSPGQPKILECLTHLGECNQKAIADYCEIEPATVGSILLRMERDGLVTRGQRNGNRRSLYVSLTPKGIQMGEAMEDIFRRADQLACTGLTPEQHRHLTDLLQVLCSSTSAMEKETQK